MTIKSSTTLGYQVYESDRDRRCSSNMLDIHAAQIEIVDDQEAISGIRFTAVIQEEDEVLQCLVLVDEAFGQLRLARLTSHG